MRSQRKRMFLAAGLLLMLIMAAIVLSIRSETAWDRAAHDENARVGFSGSTAFDIVAASELLAALQTPGGESATYELDPNRDSYKAKDRALGHLRQVTLFWRRGRESAPFVFDLYVHGPLAQPGELVVHMPKIDIRKFLFQPPPFGGENAARLQAFFEEFSRKTKVIYGPRHGSQNLAHVAFERASLGRLALEMSELATAASSLPEAAGRLKRIQRLLHNRSPIDLAAVERSLELTRGELAGDVAAKSAIERGLETIAAVASARKISHVRLVNNCREPGNFEISLDDWLGRAALRGSFAVAPDLYEEMVHRHAGFDLEALGTGLRVPRSVAWSRPAVYWKAMLPWNWLKRTPRVLLDDLLPVQPKLRSPVAELAKSGQIEVARARIPYEDYEIEVRAKAAFQAFSEPLSYVTVDPSLSMPSGFQAPDGGNAGDYWSSPKHSGEVVAHKFVFFDDLQRYQVHLSGFEVNGVYIGMSDLVDDEYDVLRTTGRWDFDLSYLEGLDRFELEVDPEGATWIRLENRDGPNRVNFLIGNLRLGVGERMEYPFGVGTQPLVSDYNDDVYQEAPLFALAYGPDGVVLDHHRRDIGVERVYVERLTTGVYKLRLVAHERIMPVWEGVIESTDWDGSQPRQP